MSIMAGGRPTLYDLKYCEMIIDHFNIAPVTYQVKTEYSKDGSIKFETKVPVAVEFPTFQSFANKIGVSVDTLHEWKKVHPEFSESYARAQEIQEHIWLVNGMSGQYNSQFAMFFGKNCLGYKDRTDQSVELTGKDGGALQVEAVRDKLINRIGRITGETDALPAVGDTGKSERQ
jgi:hypothetical protein